MPVNKGWLDHFPEEVFGSKSSHMVEKSKAGRGRHAGIPALVGFRCAGAPGGVTG